jgi:type IV pilus assembly protein PilQ
MRVLLGLGAILIAYGSAGIVRADAPDRGAPAAVSEPSSTTPPVLERFRVEERDGRDRVVIELSRPARFHVVPRRSGPATLEIRDARIADRVRRELERDGIVRGVRIRAERNRVLVEVDTQENATATAVRSGRRIVWLFSASSGTLVRPEPRTIACEERYEEESGTADVAGFLSDVPLQVQGARGGRRYGGRRIDLDFKDADIHNILRLLAEVGNVNIVTSDDVTGAVTIRMRNVPWDQALDVILQAKSLGMIRRENLIRVAPLATLEREREAAIARRKQQEQLAPLETRLVPVSYADAQSMSERVGELLSERGSVSVDERTNVLIVRDIADQLDNVEELVRTLDTQTPQVLIEARIVEASSLYTRDVGIQWGGDVTASSATGNPTGLVFPHNIGVAGGATDAAQPTGGLNPIGGGAATSDPNFAVNLPAVVGLSQGGAIGVTLGSVGGNVNLSVRLSAAEARGNVRIISSPRILTLDNHEATISQGTLIPYSQLSAQGVNTSFQEAKLELRVRPHVTSDGSVAMHVRISRDEPDFTRTGARGDPTIFKRQAETDLLIPDGNTAVIGGIYTRNTGRNLDQVPFFGDIPVLGVLFQRRRVRDDRNELLIFLTPRIVNRAQALRR